MKRILLACAWFAAAATAALADSATAQQTLPCRAAYVVPYAEQCEFAYKNLKPNGTPSDLSQAFEACGRSQDVDLPCSTSKDRGVHAVALTALYRSVTLRAEIAMDARQFVVAEAMLREKLDLIAIVQRETRPGDTTPATERKHAERELAQARAGECTERALASAGLQYSLAKAHKYAELATLLQKKYDDYQSCARLVSVPVDRAYVGYAALVALEESGRAAQAAGRRDDAKRTYRSCIDGASRVARDASPRVKGFLATVVALCKGRANGTYAVDRPQPIDAVPAAAAPVTAPSAQSARPPPGDRPSARPLAPPP